MKKIFSITIEEDLVEKFKTLSNEMCINRSSLISKMIQKWIDTNGSNKKQLLLESDK